MRVATYFILSIIMHYYSYVIYSIYIMHGSWTYPDEFTEVQEEIYNQVVLMTKSHFNCYIDINFHKEVQLDILLNV